MILQLNPSIPVITPKGSALAHALIDGGIEHDLLWVCFQDSTGECWTWKNSDIRSQKNTTQGREYISPFYNPDDVKLGKTEEKKCLHPEQLLDLFHLGNDVVRLRQELSCYSQQIKEFCSTNGYTESFVFIKIVEDILEIVNKIRLIQYDAYK